MLHIGGVLGDERCIAMVKTRDPPEIVASTECSPPALQFRNLIGAFYICSRMYLFNIVQFGMF